jgi:histidine triad (HIT) family protein
MATECVFCKIASRQILTERIYEDEEFLAFPDINPQAPVHILLIPKAHFPTLLDMKDARMLGHALLAVQETARRAGIAEEGFRTVINCGENGGQTVHHLHFHILGGRFMTWPPG